MAKQSINELRVGIFRIEHMKHDPQFNRLNANELAEVVSTPGFRDLQALATADGEDRVSVEWIDRHIGALVRTLGVNAATVDAMPVDEFAEAIKSAFREQSGKAHAAHAAEKFFPNGCDDADIRDIVLLLHDADPFTTNELTVIRKFFRETAENCPKSTSMAGRLRAMRGRKTLTLPSLKDRAHAQHTQRTAV